MTPKELLNVWKNTDPELRKLADKIPDLNQDPQMLEARQKLRELKEEIKEAERQVSEFYHQANDAPSRQYNVIQDAQRLLGGKELEGLSVDSEYANLRRRRDALRKAAELLEQEICELKLGLARKNCVDGTPAAEAVQLNTKELHTLYKELLRQLKIKAVLHQNILRCKGFAITRDYWNVRPLENAMLFGGGGFPGLEHLIALDEKFFGFGDKSKRK